MDALPAEGTDRALAATANKEVTTVPAYTGADEQLWRIEQLTDGTYRIMPKAIPGQEGINKELCLYSAGDSTPTLAKYDFNSDNSKWNFKNKHGREAVLQATNNIGITGVRYVDRHITIGHCLSLGQQQIQRIDRNGNCLVTMHDNDKQTNYEQWNNNVCETIVIIKDIAVRTHDGKAPFCLGHTHVANQRSMTINHNRHTALTTLSHLVAQGYDVRILLWVGNRENGLVEQSRRVRMPHIAALLVNH